MNGYNKCFESTNQGLGAVFEQKDRSNWAVSGSITSVKWITLENVLFPDWRWLLPIARRARCSSGDDAVRFSINFYYVSTADAEQSRGTFVIWFFLQPPFSFTLSSSHNTPFLLLSLSIRLSSVVSFVRFVCFFTFFFPFSAFFFLFYSLSRSLSTYLFGGLFEDEQLDVETRWTIVQLFARRGASASRSARVQFEKKVKFVYVDLPTFLVRHSSLAY